MRIIRVRCVSEGPALHVVPRVDAQRKISANETAAPLNEMLEKVQALCARSSSICDQMGRVMNMGGEFDRDKAVGLYQRVAALRASGIVLSAKMAEGNAGDITVSTAVEHIAQQAERMMKDLESRLANG